MINAVLGMWLMAAPGVLGYGGAGRTNDHIIGPFAAGSAIIAIGEVTRPLRWLNLVLGPWLLVAAWAFGPTGVAILNRTAVGLLLALMALLGGTVRRHYAGGWSALGRPDPPRAS